MPNIPTLSQAIGGAALLVSLHVDAQIIKNEDTIKQILNSQDKLSMHIDTIQADTTTFDYTSADTLDHMLRMDFEKEFVDSLREYQIHTDSLIHTLNLPNYGEFSLDFSDHKHRTFSIVSKEGESTVYTIDRGFPIRVIKSKDIFHKMSVRIDQDSVIFDTAHFYGIKVKGGSLGFDEFVDLISEIRLAVKKGKAYPSKSFTQKYGGVELKLDQSGS